MRANAFVSALFLTTAGCGAGAITSSRVPQTDVTVHQYKLPISNVFAVETPSAVVLVDAGDPDQEDFILSALAQTGIDATRVKALVITHGHADHAGSAFALAQRLNVPIVLQAGDATMARAGKNAPLHPTSMSASLIELFLTQSYVPFEADAAYENCFDLHSYGVPAVVVSAPGHTEGSSIVLLDGGEAIVGDLFAGGYLGGELSPGTATEHYFQDDRARVRAIVDALLAAGVTRFHVGHGGPVSAESLREAVSDGALGDATAPAFTLPSCAK